MAVNRLTATPMIVTDLSLSSKNSWFSYSISVTVHSAYIYIIWNYMETSLAH